MEEAKPTKLDGMEEAKSEVDLATTRPRLTIVRQRTPLDCSGVNDEDYVVTCQGASRQVCTNGAIVSTACGDSNACNGTESCSAGICQAGTPPVVNDNNPCTTDSCNPATGVSNTPVASGTACADGNLCNGNETCNASGTCLVGTTPVINDNNPCTTDACSPTTRVSHAPVASGTACADGNLCNGNETCNSSGSCMSGTAPIVNDNNPCTADACSPATGVSHTPVASGTACADGNLCNGNETCNGSGTCLAGTTPVINDNNPCTTDACSPTTGVSHAPVASGTACADGNLCNGNETCNGSGTCVPGTAPVLNDGNPCTVDYSSLARWRCYDCCVWSELSHRCGGRPRRNYLLQPLPRESDRSDQRGR